MAGMSASSPHQSAWHTGTWVINHASHVAPANVGVIFWMCMTTPVFGVVAMAFRAILNYPVSLFVCSSPPPCSHRLTLFIFIAQGVRPHDVLKKSLLYFSPAPTINSSPPFSFQTGYMFITQHPHPPHAVWKWWVMAVQCKNITHYTSAQIMNYCINPVKLIGSNK